MVSDQIDVCLFGSRDLDKSDLAESTLAPGWLGNGQLRMLLSAWHLFPLNFPLGKHFSTLVTSVCGSWQLPLEAMQGVQGTC